MPSSDVPGDRSEAEALFLQYLALKKAGSSISFNDFCARIPEHADELRQLERSWSDVEQLLHTMLHDGQALTLEQLLAGPAGPDQLPEQTLLLRAGRTHAPGPAELAALLDQLRRASTARGPYEERGEVGRGGMGVVRRVWDASLRRDLAMKVMVGADAGPAVPPGADSEALRRFLDEAWVTGQLDHPGIVPVHELGVDDHGRPYFTMKLVKGTTLRTILDEYHAGRGGWTANRIVGVIQRVCEAVAYAHSKRVIHRDIKPPNIMVGRYGETFLMDWGLARLLAGPGAHEADAVPPAGKDELAPDSWLFEAEPALQGTPIYMSPEQALGDIAHVDERSDIYSLGALLYHLLTGRMPYVEPGVVPTPFEVLMRLRRESPQPVLELAPEAPPTLVGICSKAMARAIEDRYSSAAEMAAELRDYLEDISEAREEARRQARRARRINEFLTQMLASGDPAEARGRDVTVREVLDRAAAGIDTALPGLVGDEAALRLTIGRLYVQLGAYESAESHLRRSHELHRQLLGEAHTETLVAATELGLLLNRLGRTQEAERLLRATLAAQEALLGADDPATLRTASILALTLQREQANLDEVERLRRHVWERRQAMLGADHLDTLNALVELANLLRDMGRPGDAVPLNRRAHAGLQALHGDNHPSTLVALNDLAHSLSRAGQPDEAEAIYRRLIPAQGSLLGAEHPSTLTAMNNLGNLLQLRGDLREAGELLEQVLDIQCRRFGPEHHSTLAFAHNLALLRLDQGRTAESQSMLAECVARAERVLAPGHSTTARFRFNLGRCLARQGHAARARSTLREAHAALLGAGLAPEHPWVREAGEALAALDRAEAPPPAGGASPAGC